MTFLCCERRVSECRSFVASGNCEPRWSRANERAMIIIVCHIMAQLKHAPLSSFSLMHTPWMWFLRCGYFFSASFPLVPAMLCSFARIDFSFLFSLWSFHFLPALPQHHRHGYTQTDDHNLWLTIIISISFPRLCCCLYGQCYHPTERLRFCTEETVVK